MSIDVKNSAHLAHVVVLGPNFVELALSFISLFILLGWFALPGITLSLLLTPLAGKLRVYVTLHLPFCTSRV